MTGADSLRRSPLHAEHERLAATFVEFAGWAMPARYRSELAEHRAVRTAAGLFDLSHMGEIEVHGDDAGIALDFALVGRPSVIGIERARYTMMCAADGGVIDDLVVYRLAIDRYLLVANAANIRTVAAELNDRLRLFKARVWDASADWALLAVQGPASAEILSAVVDSDPGTLTYYSIEPTQLGAVTVLIARTGYTGEDGFEIYCQPGHARQVWTRLEAAGKAHGLVPSGLAARDTLRLEAGMPLYGRELTERTTPFDAGLGRVVAFGKPGSFVGEEALRRHRDAAATQRLVGLTCPGRRSPRAGYAVIDPHTDVQIGRVTSGAPSPTLGHSIAMAYVLPGFADPGRRLLVSIRGAGVEATVTALPFYERPPNESLQEIP